MLDNYIARVSKCVALAGAITTVSDICQPIAPVSAWVFVGSLFAITILFVVRRVVGNKIGLVTDGMWVSGCALFLSGALFLLQGSAEESKDRGFLAAQSTAVERLQSDLGLVGKQLDEISHKLENVKKEVSEDPKKELANQGLSWKYESFLESLYNRDYAVIELYARGGMKLRNSDLQMFFNSFNDERLKRLLVEYKSFQAGGECPSLSNSLSFYVDRLGDRLDVEALRIACGIPSFNDDLNNALGLEVGYVNDAKSFNNSRGKVIESCINTYGPLPVGHYVDKYFKYYSGFESSPKDEPIEEAIAYFIYSEMIGGRTGKYSKRSDSVRDLSKRFCNSMNQERIASNERVIALRKIKEVLF
jgi:hypothetical protein